MYSTSHIYHIAKSKNISYYKTLETERKFQPVDKSSIHHNQHIGVHQERKQQKTGSNMPSVTVYANVLT